MIDLEVSERRGRGRPPNSTKPKRALTGDEVAAGRKQERELEKQEYKAEMQKYMKERLRQGKAKIKLEASIKLLEARMKTI